MHISLENTAIFLLEGQDVVRRKYSASFMRSFLLFRKGILTFDLVFSSFLFSSYTSYIIQDFNNSNSSFDIRKNFDAYTTTGSGATESNMDNIQKVSFYNVVIYAFFM